MTKRLFIVLSIIIGSLGILGLTVYLLKLFLPPISIFLLIAIAITGWFALTTFVFVIGPYIYYPIENLIKWIKNGEWESGDAGER